MGNKITITLDEDKYQRILTELYSSYEQLLDVDENEWAKEVEELHKYLRELDIKKIS